MRPVDVVRGSQGVVVRVCAFAWTPLPRGPRASSSSSSRLLAFGRSPLPAVAMLPAAVLHRPGLRVLVRQARAYAEAAAAPAPAAGPGQMSFTFASPTQVRMPVWLGTPSWSPSPVRTRSGPQSETPTFGLSIPICSPPQCRPESRLPSLRVSGASTPESLTPHS